MEYHVVVNRYVNVNVFRVYADGRVRLWAYARTVADAVRVAAALPTRIVVTA